MEAKLIYLFLRPDATADAIALYLIDVQLYSTVTAYKLAESVAAKVARILNLGYSIKYNPFWGTYQIYHPEIAATVEESKDLEYCINHCLNG